MVQKRRRTLQIRDLHADDQDSNSWISGNFNCYLFTVKEEFFTRLRFKEKKFVIYNLIEGQFCAKSPFNSK